MKPRILYSDLQWLSAFERIKEGETLTARGVTFRVDWKHIDPPWLKLKVKRGEYVMVRKGDSLIHELSPNR